MTIWRTRIACWIPKSKNTHSEYAILIAFYCNSGCTTHLSVTIYDRLVLEYNFVVTMASIVKWPPVTTAWASSSFIWRRRSSDMERTCESIQYAVEGRRSAVVVRRAVGRGDNGLSPWNVAKYQRGTGLENQRICNHWNGLGVDGRITLSGIIVNDDQQDATI